MPLSYQIIECQTPPNLSNINKIYKIVKVTFQNTAKNKQWLIDKATEFASKVNPHAANHSEVTRNNDRLILDAMGGILAEYGWLVYINRIFGDATVSFTEFNSSNSQIDLLLNNGKTIEVRSSFVRNGIKFGICNERYNFKNICKYENLYKPGEIDKDFFACVLFETQKQAIINASEIIFYLVGGSTRAMMMNDNISFVSDLVAEDDYTQTKTRYKVIKLKDAMDINDFENYLIQMGYKKQKVLPVGSIF